MMYDALSAKIAWVCKLIRRSLSSVGTNGAEWGMVTFLGVAVLR